ncbi:amino acid permease family protein [Aspergillus heteromorphus CBS 117.55]|uniref:Amino acid permease family protein n=1 Tax=Aspergillus heteromorphus CBS 117.55 TaxID=1448321 RepID=A0A317VQ56_9EURO|nr:amino acid permease family protein [Aspergillus heteromorphus CBS 117.55]PWY75401.1 amino acid permease family protein [Aspergillus heteromorphus CBS 117.55]
MDLENHGPIKPIQSVDQSVQDAHDLAAMGHDQAMSRKFDMWSMLSLAFCVLGTYSTFAQDLDSGLTNGGPVTILWGLVLVTVCNLCVAVSLGELTSSMPTALGQAYWVFRLWDTPLGRFASYMCAWINTFGWWTLTASQVAFMAEFLLGMKFVVYIGVVFVLTVINLVGCRREKILPWLNNFVGIWFTALFVVLSLALLISVGVKKGLTFQPASFVFGEWMNETGWENGVVWFTGLVQAAYGLTAFDAVIHMVEEIPAPRRNAPKVIWMSVLMGAITGFIFMVVCLFCIQDVNEVINSPTGLPFMELMVETVGLEGGAVLIALFIFNGLGQGISILTTASRLTWGFARDGGLPWSGYFMHIDPVWKVPARALWFQGVLIGLVGILYLFANTVLEAILSVSTIALTISYGLPIAALLVVGRDKLPPGHFHLGRWGALINWISVIYCLITTVFFLFPSSPNPSPSDMNYAIAVFGVMLVVAVAFWFIQGSSTYLKTEDAINQMIQAQRFEVETAEQSDEKKE